MKMLALALTMMLFIFLTARTGSRNRSARLELAAKKTIDNFRKYRPDSTSSEIPPFCWHRAVKSLRPLRAYLHADDRLVIVRHTTSAVEEGIYFLAYARVMVPLNGRDGFRFIPYPGNTNHRIFKYQRPATTHQGDEA